MVISRPNSSKGSVPERFLIIKYKLLTVIITQGKVTFLIPSESNLSR